MSIIATVRFKDNDLTTIMNGLKLEQVKSVVFEKFLINIEQCIKKNKNNAIFCYIDDDYQVNINKNEFLNVLNVLEEYYSSKEKYEVCSKIKQLKEDHVERKL